jgi:hypothetical protein
MTDKLTKKTAVDMLKNSTAVRKAVMAMRNRVINVTNDFNKSKVVKSHTNSPMFIIGYAATDANFNIGAGLLAKALKDSKGPLGTTKTLFLMSVNGMVKVITNPFFGVVRDGDVVNRLHPLLGSIVVDFDNKDHSDLFIDFAFNKNGVGFDDVIDALADDVVKLMNK